MGCGQSANKSNNTVHDGLSSNNSFVHSASTSKHQSKVVVNKKFLEADLSKSTENVQVTPRSTNHINPVPTFDTVSNRSLSRTSSNNGSLMGNGSSGHYEHRSPNHQRCRSVSPRRNESPFQHQLFQSQTPRSGRFSSSLLNMRNKPSPRRPKSPQLSKLACCC
jgi:hypothetical protein